MQVVEKMYFFHISKFGSVAYHIHKDTAKFFQ